jgi:DEAD/DEAH box helicase domain-containing protein
MNLAQIIDHMRTSPYFQERVTAWHETPGHEARTAPYPAWLDPALVEAFQARGVKELYTHQRQAVEAVHRGEHVVVVTPTASRRAGYSG